MKIMCISDIHSSIEDLTKTIGRYKEEKAEKLLILGDITGSYFSVNDKQIVKLLNNMSGAIIAVKGNCDNSYMESMLNFKLGLLKTIDVNDKKITLTHGHIYNGNNLPENCGDIFLSGHTHVGMIEKLGDKIIANPGSISKPRNGRNKSYITIDKESIELKELNSSAVKKRLFF